MEIKNITKHRVRYSDTDHFGVVYYARYLDWFEIGRTEILRSRGISYAQLERDGFFAPVVEIKVNYKKPARYDEIILLETSVSKIGNSSIRFDYRVYNEERELLAVAYTINVFVDRRMKPVKIPTKLKEALH